MTQKAEAQNRKGLCGWSRQPEHLGPTVPPTLLWCHVAFVASSGGRITTQAPGFWSKAMPPCSTCLLRKNSGCGIRSLEVGCLTTGTSRDDAVDLTSISFSITRSGRPAQAIVQLRWCAQDWRQPESEGTGRYLRRSPNPSLSQAYGHMGISWAGWTRRKPALCSCSVTEYKLWWP